MRGSEEPERLAQFQLQRPFLTGGDVTVAWLAYTQLARGQNLPAGPLIAAFVYQQDTTLPAWMGRSVTGMPQFAAEA